MFQTTNQIIYIYIYIMTYRDGNLGIYDEADPKCKIAIIIVFF